MPRKTPVEELQDEENSRSGSPILRRSTRIAQSAPASPAPISGRRRSADTDSPARLTKSKRLSLSQESSVDGESVGTPKRTRNTRSASKSPISLAKENETKGTPIKSRSRRGSVSKVIEEESESSRPASPIQKSKHQRRSESKSPTSVKEEPQGVKVKTRRGSVTEKIVPLEPIVESETPEKQLKKKTDRATILSSTDNALDTIKENEKSSNVDAVEELAEKESEKQLKWPKRKMSTGDEENSTKKEEDAIKNVTSESIAINIENNENVSEGKPVAVEKSGGKKGTENVDEDTSTSTKGISSTVSDMSINTKKNVSPQKPDFKKITSNDSTDEMCIVKPLERKNDEIITSLTKEIENLDSLKQDKPVLSCSRLSLKKDEKIEPPVKKKSEEKIPVNLLSSEPDTTIGSDVSFNLNLTMSTENGSQEDTGTKCTTVGQELVQSKDEENVANVSSSSESSNKENVKETNLNSNVEKKHFASSAEELKMSPKVLIERIDMQRNISLQNVSVEVERMDFNKVEIEDKLIQKQIVETQKEAKLKSPKVPIKLVEEFFEEPMEVEYADICEPVTPLKRKSLQEESSTKNDKSLQFETSTETSENKLVGGSEDKSTEGIQNPNLVKENDTTLQIDKNTELSESAQVNKKEEINELVQIDENKSQKVDQTLEEKNINKCDVKEKEIVRSNDDAPNEELTKVSSLKLTEKVNLAEETLEIDKTRSTEDVFEKKMNENDSAIDVKENTNDNVKIKTPVKEKSSSHQGDIEDNSNEKLQNDNTFIIENSTECEHMSEDTFEDTNKVIKEHKSIDDFEDGEVLDESFIDADNTKKNKDDKNIEPKEKSLSPIFSLNEDQILSDEECNFDENVTQEKTASTDDRKEKNVTNKNVVSNVEKNLVHTNKNIENQETSNDDLNKNKEKNLIQADIENKEEISDDVDLKQNNLIRNKTDDSNVEKDVIQTDENNENKTTNDYDPKENLIPNMENNHIHIDNKEKTASDIDLKENNLTEDGKKIEDSNVEKDLIQADNDKTLNDNDPKEFNINANKKEESNVEINLIQTDNNIENENETSNDIENVNKEVDSNVEKGLNQGDKNIKNKEETSIDNDPKEDIVKGNVKHLEISTPDSVTTENMLKSDNLNEIELNSEDRSCEIEELQKCTIPEDGNISMEIEEAISITNESKSSVNDTQNSFSEQDSFSIRDVENKQIDKEIEVDENCEQLEEQNVDEDANNKKAQTLKSNDEDNLQVDDEINKSQDSKIILDVSTDTNIKDFKKTAEEIDHKSVEEEATNTLDKKLKALIDKVSESSSSDEDHVSDFIDDECEEGEEDTPSKGSNDISYEGESLHSEDTDLNSDESYEQNSFIDDNEVVELLSGEDDLMDKIKSKVEKKGLNGKKVRSRIIEVSDSEEDVNEVFVESQDNLAETETKKVSNTDGKLQNEEQQKVKATESKEFELDDDQMSTNPYLGLTPPSQASQDSSDSDIQLIANSIDIPSPSRKEIGSPKKLDITTQPTIISKNLQQITTPSKIINVDTDEEDDSEKGNKSLQTPSSNIDLNASSSQVTSKRKSSINIQENIKLEDIKDGDLSERISKVVDWFYSGIKNNKDISGNISLNVSLDYANGIVDEDVPEEKNIECEAESTTTRKENLISKVPENRLSNNSTESLFTEKLIEEAEIVSPKKKHSKKKNKSIESLTESIAIEEVQLIPTKSVEDDMKSNEIDTSQNNKILKKKHKKQKRKLESDKGMEQQSTADQNKGNVENNEAITDIGKIIKKKQKKKSRDDVFTVTELKEECVGYNEATLPKKKQKRKSITDGGEENMCVVKTKKQNKRSVSDYEKQAVVDLKRALKEETKKLLKKKQKKKLVNDDEKQAVAEINEETIETDVVESKKKRKKQKRKPISDDVEQQLIKLPNEELKTDLKISKKKHRKAVEDLPTEEKLKEKGRKDIDKETEVILQRPKKPKHTQKSVSDIKILESPSLEKGKKRKQSTEKNIVPDRHDLVLEKLIDDSVDKNTELSIKHLKQKSKKQEQNKMKDKKFKINSEDIATTSCINEETVGNKEKKRKRKTSEEKRSVSYFPSELLDHLANKKSKLNKNDDKNLKTKSSEKKQSSFAPSKLNNNDNWEAASDIEFRPLFKTTADKECSTKFAKKQKTSDWFESFTNSDFKNKMLYDPSRVKRTDTKTFLRKKHKLV